MVEPGGDRGEAGGDGWGGGGCWRNAQQMEDNGGSGGAGGVDGFFFFKQTTAYEIYQCDWSSDVCSSDLSDRNRANRRDMR